ncbi:MAG: flavodoxin family protein [Actinomycetota bacterium]|nr:flavodoxin family protein [Actinomycetota bacterium]
MQNNPKSKNKSFKIAAIYGSPRKKGNTGLLLDSFLEGTVSAAAVSKKDLEIKKIITASLNISSCRGCGNCSKTGECIIDDDMQQVYKDLIEADFLAVASPVFFTTVSGYLKA